MLRFLSANALQRNTGFIDGRSYILEAYIRICVNGLIDGEGFLGG